MRNSKTIKILENHHAYLLRLVFTEDSLRINKGLESVSGPYFSQKFLITFFLLCYINWLNFITKLGLFSKLFSIMCFMFHVSCYQVVCPTEYIHG